jgi:phosphatidylserine synthase
MFLVIQQQDIISQPMIPAILLLWYQPAFKVYSHPGLPVAAMQLAVSMIRLIRYQLQAH